jgi:hypothetical protein
MMSQSSLAILADGKEDNGQGPRNFNDGWSLLYRCSRKARAFSFLSMAG